MKSIIEILSFLSYTLANEVYRSTYIKDISIDSRFKGQNWCFITYKTPNINRNKYILSAIKNGAILILIDSDDDFSEVIPSTDFPIIYIKNIRSKLSKISSWFYEKPSKKLNVIAVTGTNGKTSVSHLCAQLLFNCREKTGILGTIGNGCWPNLSESLLTTPDIVSIQRNIAEFNILKVNTIVLEASSHGLYQKRLDGIDIDIAIWTNLSHDHLDYHENMESYFKAKSSLFKFDSLKYIVINIDDIYGKRLINENIVNNNANLITYSLKYPQADLYIEINHITDYGYEITVNFKKETYLIKTPLMGEFNLYNLAASLLSVYALGIPFNDLIKKIENLSPIIGRMQKLTYTNEPSIIIDYAHTPDALKNALITLKKHYSTKLWCVFGCGGDRDKSKRSKMATISEQYSDEVILTEDNNRTENFYNIINDIEVGFVKNKKYKIIESRLNAIKFVLDNAKKEDVIFIAGKGHEHYLDKNNEKIYFNEKEIIENLWRQ